MEKRIKSVLPIAAAIILGIVSVVIIHRYISAKTNVPELKKVYVMVAAEPIQPSQSISMSQLTTKEIVETAVSDVNIVVPYSADPKRNADEINKLKTMIAGRQSSRNINIGSSLLWTDLKDIDAQSLSDIIAKNKRAVTIPVNQISSVGFNIIPGDKVDIIATRSDSGCGGGGQANSLNLSPATSVRDLLEASKQAPMSQQATSKTFVVMQNVLVLAIGQDYNTFQGRTDRSRNYASVTLEVSLEEGMMLTHVSSNATLSMMLRNLSSMDRSPANKILETDCNNIKASIAELDKLRAQELQSKGNEDNSVSTNLGSQTPKK
jgi:Flp pilus assembly protein CpaB